MVQTIAPEYDPGVDPHLKMENTGRSIPQGRSNHKTAQGGLYHSVAMCSLNTIIPRGLYHSSPGGLLPTITANLPPITADVPPIYRRFTADLPPMYRRCTADLPPIYRRFTTNLPPIYRRFRFDFGSIWDRFWVGLGSIWDGF